MYVVTGGNTGLSGVFDTNPGDRTETFVEGSNSWTLESAKLEQRHVWMTMLSIDNRVFLSGTTSDIFELNKTKVEWERIGEISAPRQNHRMASVDVTDFGCSM